MSSIFGQFFRISTFGETHGNKVGVVVDGCPPRLEISAEEIQRDLDRRRPGQSRLTTQRDESDSVEILSGVFEGKTLGTPISLAVPNTDQKPAAYDHLKDLYRPSHADYTYEAKYGHRDHRGGGRSSARETVGRVAAGAIARKLLSVTEGVEVLAWVSRVKDLETNLSASEVTLEDVEADPTRCPDAEVAAAMTEAINAARKDGDSLGGVVSVVGRGVPVGLGDPVFDRLEALLAMGMLSLPAAKGFEVGSGFAGTFLTGRDHNDPFTTDDTGRTVTTTNNSGGVQGGISNGADLLCRVAFKPTATISSSQQTVTTEGEPVELEAKGRHDPCVLPRAVPLVEAMMLLTLADRWLAHKTVNVGL